MNVNYMSDSESCVMDYDECTSNDLDNTIKIDKHQNIENKINPEIKIDEEKKSKRQQKIDIRHTNLVKSNFAVKDVSTLRNIKRDVGKLTKHQINFIRLDDLKLKRTKRLIVNFEKKSTKDNIIVKNKLNKSLKKDNSIREKLIKKRIHREEKLEKKLEKEHNSDDSGLSPIPIGKKRKFIKNKNQIKTAGRYIRRIYNLNKEMELFEYMSANYAKIK